MIDDSNQCCYQLLLLRIWLVTPRILYVKLSIKYRDKVGVLSLLM